MKVKLFLLLSLLSFGLSGAVRAEGGCPPGQYPISGQGWQGCAPIPGYDQSPTSSQPEQPPARWESHWGAIATDGVKGILGMATGEADQSEAEQKALGQCRAKGGSACKIQTSYANGCAAMIVGSNGFSTAIGSTIEEAVSKGTKICRSDGDTNCHVYYTDCSLPGLIR